MSRVDSQAMSSETVTSALHTPHILGLTGGIGAGKSFVGRLLVEAGLPLFDSDVVGRGAYTESDQVRQQVLELLGCDAYDSEGKPRYGEIAGLVFAPSVEGKQRLHQLEQIIHPYVSERLLRWSQEQAAPKGWVVLESAILWQSGFYRHCDAVVVVIAPEAVRLSRVQKRDGVTLEQVQARMNRQASLSLTVLRQTYPELPIYTIDNDGTQELEGQVAQLLRQLSSL